MLQVPFVHLRPSTFRKQIVRVVFIPQHLLHKDEKLTLKRTVGKMLAIFHQRAQGTAERLLRAVFQRLTNRNLYHDPGDIVLHRFTLPLALV